MPLVIVVDDIRSFVPDREGTIYLRTSQDAMAYLLKCQETNTAIDELWLDFDLGLKSEADAIVIARWLEDEAENMRKLPIEEIMVHSSNVVGAHQLMRCLDDHYKCYRRTTWSCDLHATED